MTAPTQIAHYKITGKLGEGGMGVVYRATDTKLNRDVAIKVLPETMDADRLTRFTREAHALDIAVVYGVEDRAIVMDLVDGAELRGPVPLDTALHYAGQIADALEAAHEKGITLRDLKPANIKITPQGTVKVLDFGLAKIGESTHDPAVTMTMGGATQAGMVMGTPGYMAPEQARGQAVDKRADIWAFGIVLWEMLTGKKLFGGETVSDAFAAVLTKEPDLEKVPPTVRRLLKRCLEKDPRKRLRDIGDWRELLEESSQQKPAQSKIWPAAAVLLALTTAGTATLYFRQSIPQPAPIRFEIPAPDKASFGREGMALSPDGSKLAFIAFNAEGVRMLWVRRLDSTGAQLLPETEGAFNAPFWSPDSRFIGFLAQGKVKKVDSAGGPPETLCEFALPGVAVLVDLATARDDGAGELYVE